MVEVGVEVVITDAKFSFEKAAAAWIPLCGEGRGGSRGGRAGAAEVVVAAAAAGGGEFDDESGGAEELIDDV